MGFDRWLFLVNGCLKLKVITPLEILEPNQKRELLHSYIFAAGMGPGDTEIPGFWSSVVDMDVTTGVSTSHQKTSLPTSSAEGMIVHCTIGGGILGQLHDRCFDFFFDF